MKFTLDNFVRSVLAVDATAGDTSLVLTLAAPPARDPPDATADAPGILVLQDSPAAATKIEIVTYTGRSIVDTQVTLTGVTRGCEGTTAQSWTTGTPTFSGTTAAAMGSKEDAIPAGTTDQYVRGDKTLGTFAAAVLAAVLTGLSTATNAAITASDTVLAALGKLQAQISANVSAIAANAAALAGKVPTSRKVNGKALSADIALSASDVGAASTATADALAALSPAAAKAVTDWNVPLAAGGAQFIASSSGSSNGPGGNFYVGINLPYTSGSTGGQLALRLSPANTELWFRAANGTGAPWMQAVAADQSGNATVDGTLTVASGFVSGGTGSTVVFGCAVGAAANVTLRPNGINSAAGQFYVKPTGEVVANGTITAPAIALGSGKTLSKITVSSAAPGTLADGELYLQY